MLVAGNKAKHLLLVNYTTKTIHHIIIVDEKIGRILGNESLEENVCILGVP